jgi:hypothetical protein
VTTLADYPELDIAFRRHDGLERSYRRQAFMDRAQGRDPEQNEIAVEEHHRAAMWVSQEAIVPERESA